MVQQTLRGDELIGGRRMVLRDLRFIKLAAGYLAAASLMGLSLLTYNFVVATNVWLHGGNSTGGVSPFWISAIFFFVFQALAYVVFQLRGSVIVENGRLIRNVLQSTSVAIDSNLPIIRWPEWDAKQIGWEFRSGGKRVCIRSVEGLDDLVEQIRRTQT